MTTINSNVQNWLTTWTNHGIRLSWSSTRSGIDAKHPGRLRRVELVLTIQFAGPAHSIVESWVESDDQRRSLLPRQCIASAIRFDGSMLHIDCGRSMDGTPKLATFTLRDVDGAGEAQLLYAQTSLLSAAGFGPGAYDPPRMRRIAVEPVAATA